jgi:anti-sigma factor RsiW
MECPVVRDEMMEALYGEASAETSRRVDEHLTACAACRDEMASLRRVRRDLGAWKLPALTRSRGTAASRHRFRAPLAAAAGFVLALGASFAFSGSELSLDEGHFAFRLGRGADALRELRAAELRQRREIDELRAAIVPVVAPSASGEAVVLERVQALLRESEERQAQRLATQLRELSIRTEAQRRSDLARVSAGLSYLDGKTGQHIARTTELMGYVLQAAEKR